MILLKSQGAYMHPKTKNLVYATLLSLAACDHLDDLSIPPQPSGVGWMPEPFPAVPGAWEPCNEATDCVVQNLACHVPPSPKGEFYGGSCTWTCREDSDCSDLAVDEKAVPRCLEGLCELRCYEFDGECPAGMTCAATTGEVRICVWQAEN